MFFLESFSNIKAFLLVLCYPCDINSKICDFVECNCYCFYFKDTLKAFDDFRNKQQKCMK